MGKTERTAETVEADDRDELFDEAVRFCVQSKQASTSMLQRRFRIGFSRAGRLVEGDALLVSGRAAVRITGRRPSELMVWGMG